MGIITIKSENLCPKMMLSQNVSASKFKGGGELSSLLRAKLNYEGRSST